MLDYISNILNSTNSSLLKQTSENKQSKKDCSSSKSTFFISIEEFVSKRKRHNSLIPRRFKTKENIEKTELRKKSTSLCQKKSMKVVKMKLEFRQYNNIQKKNNIKEDGDFKSNLNSSEISTNTTTDISISSPIILTKKESAKIPEIKQISKNIFENGKLPINVFLPLKQAVKRPNKIKNLGKDKDNKNKSELRDTLNDIIIKKDSKRINGSNDYNCDYDLTKLREEPPKVTQILKSNINLINKDKFSLSNITYGIIRKDKIVNSFYNHLFFEEKIGNKKIIQTCFTKRNKGKLLTVIYFNKHFDN